MSAEPENTLEAPSLRFSDLALPESLMKALQAVGYESPSPIQAATIPPLLDGRDVLGQAQTGTGKTAAFALPLLARIGSSPAGAPQVLVLAPTRELAIQVAEAFQKYASFIPGFHVLPIYGGQAYGPQLSALKRGVHVVVGTPGRVIDHLDRGSLDLSKLKALVLDEADEMLRMGFIDDVEAVLKKTPPERQVALFSATMPPPIKRIAQTYLKDPVEVAIKAKTTTATNIRQRMWMVSGMHKLDALTRILEAETFDAMIIFARTKQATQELAEKLAARGLAAAAIHGDVQQAQRERTIQQLKDGKIDILVATDVAARGLDVERISHVLNYDIPYDTESYVHRIGRTGRAGRSGEAILFVSPRERGMLKAIERATRQPIEPMNLPSVQAVNDSRISRFLDRITQARQQEGIEPFRALVERYETEQNVPAIEIAAALARLVQGDAALLLDPNAREPRMEREERGERPERRERTDFDKAPRQPRGEPMSWRPEARQPRDDSPPKARPAKFEAPRPPEAGFATYWIAVGHAHQVKPGNIVGAIANEAGLDAAHIGRINIRTNDTLVDLPEGMPKEIMAHLKKVRVAGQALMLKAYDPTKDDSGELEGAARPFVKKPGFKAGGYKGDNFKPGGFKGKPRSE